jgi:hypothetical protein
MLKRFILWDFPRATWQYDLMVGIILAFIFLTPRDWFRDQPRMPHASSIAMLPSERGSTVFWIDAQLLDGVAEQSRSARSTEILRTRTGEKRISVTQVEPVYNSESELQGYMAFARP